MITLKFNNLDAVLSSEAAGSSPEYSVTVLGDIRIEYRATLALAEFGKPPVDHFEFAPIDFVVAGTAVNFALAARSIFKKVNVISRIGTDEFTPMLNGYLGSICSSYRLGRSEGRNGIVLLIRDMRSTRVLVSGIPTPSADITVKDIDMAMDALNESDIFITDGYLLLADQARSAVKYAISEARKRRVVVCFDIVPHDVYNYMTSDEIIEVVREADIVISNARTLAALLGLAAPYPFAHELLPPLVQALEDWCPGRRWHLRYGWKEVEYTSIVEGRNFISTYASHATPETLSGLGDRLAAKELFDFLRLNGAG